MSALNPATGRCAIRRRFFLAGSANRRPARLARFLTFCVLYGGRLPVTGCAPAFRHRHPGLLEKPRNSVPRWRPKRLPATVPWRRSRGFSTRLRRCQRQGQPRLPGGPPPQTRLRVALPESGLAGAGSGHPARQVRESRPLTYQSKLGTAAALCRSYGHANRARTAVPTRSDGSGKPGILFCSAFRHRARRMGSRQPEDRGE